MKRWLPLGLILSATLALGQGKVPAPGLVPFAPGTSSSRGYFENYSGASFALRFNEHWGNFTVTYLNGGVWFTKNSASAVLDVGANDDLVVEFVLSRSLGAHVVFSTKPDPAANGYYVVRFGSATTMILDVVADDGTTVAYSFTIPNYTVNYNIPHKFKIVLDRDGNASAWTDGVAATPISAADLIGKTITNKAATINAHADGTVAGVARYYEIAVGVGVSTLGNYGPGSGVTPYQRIAVGTSGLKAQWIFTETASPLVDRINAIELPQAGTLQPNLWAENGGAKVADLYDSINNLKLEWTGSVVDQANDRGFNVATGVPFGGMSPGIRLDANQHFLSASGPSGMAPGTSDFTAELYFMFASGPSDGYRTLFATINGDWDGLLFYVQYHSVNYPNGRLVWYFEADDDTPIANDSVNFPASVFDNAYRKLRIWLDRDANLQIWLDGISIYTASIAGTAAKSIPAHTMYVGHDIVPSGGNALVWTPTFMRFEKALINSGGPGGG